MWAAHVSAFLCLCPGTYLFLCVRFFVFVRVCLFMCVFICAIGHISASLHQMGHYTLGQFNLASAACGSLLECPHTMAMTTHAVDRPTGAEEAGESTRRPYSFRRMFVVCFVVLALNLTSFFGSMT